MAISSSSKNVAKRGQFGTFKGVFIPSILTILGVIMFLRLGWVVGHAGLVGAILIITLSSVITFLTGLSISATATNMKVGGGGAYYMISRSLGIEAGAAVGLPLYLAQAFGIAFYLSGFSESVCGLFPSINPIVVSVMALAGLAFLAYVSADLALKTQLLILSILVLALLSFFIADLDQVVKAPNSIKVTPDLGFWAVFAVFFPAVTGIEAGLSMSGDLKDPSKALPMGTLSAIICGFLVYISIAVFISQFADSSLLKDHTLIMMDIAKWDQLIVLGVWGASLSSALGALLGAPRTMQALARDGVIPKLFGRGYGADDAPQFATAITAIIVIVAIILGDLNVIAPILSMFFLTSYGMLNFSSGIESLIANPSWRPSFKTPWYISMLGAFFCFSAMFMIDPGATIISLCLSFSVYYFMQKRKITVYWGDMRYGILMYLVRFSVQKLSKLNVNSKSWRPNVLVLCGMPSKRWYLVELGSAMASDSGFLTVASIIPHGKDEETRLVEHKDQLESYLATRRVNAIVKTTAAEDVTNGVVSLVRSYGLGPIIPNTIVLGETEQKDKFEYFAEMIIRMYQSKRNIVIVRIPEDYDYETSRQIKENLLHGKAENHKSIEVWWGRERNNASLALALGFMLQSNGSWRGAELNLKSVTNQESELKSAQKLLDDLLHKSRLDAKSYAFYQAGERTQIFDRIRKESQTSSMVFLGMHPPSLEQYRINPEKTVSEYAEYYKKLLHNTRDFPPLSIVLAAEDIDFNQIFVA